MAIQWGGNHGDRIMFEVKGIPTQKAVEAFRCHFPHRVTRLDACADFDEQGAFNRLYRACMRVKKEHRIKGSKAGIGRISGGRPDVVWRSTKPCKGKALRERATS